MEVIAHRNTINQQINGLYHRLALNCITHPENLQENKEDFFMLEKICQDNEQEKSFYAGVYKLCDYLEKSGKPKIANVLYTELGKIYCVIGDTEQAEKILKKSIQLSNSMGDKIHVLHRLTDLEMLYKKQRNGKNLYCVLKEKLTCCDEILENYDTYAKNFNTIKKTAITPEQIKIQQAFAYTDLANIVKHKNPQHAIKLNQKALNIYKEMGREKEVKYLEKRIEVLTQNQEQTKI